MGNSKMISPNTLCTKMSRYNKKEALDIPKVSQYNGETESMYNKRIISIYTPVINYLENFSLDMSGYIPYTIISTPLSPSWIYYTTTSTSGTTYTIGGTCTNQI